MATIKRISETTEGIVEAHETAVATCEELKGAMAHWTAGLRTNRQDRNMERSSTYKEAEFAIYDLDVILGKLETVYIPDDLEGEEITFETVNERYRPGKLQNVVSRLQAVRERLEFLECEVGDLPDAISILELVKFPHPYSHKKKQQQT